MNPKDKYVYFVAFEFRIDGVKKANFCSSHLVNPIVTPDDFNKFVAEIKRDMKPDENTFRITSLSLIHTPRNR